MSVEAAPADSTRSMRKSVYERNLASEVGRLKLEEITLARLMARCEKIKERGAAAPAVQVRDIVLQVYRFVQARGLKVDNPAEAIRPSAIARFKPRDRTLTPAGIHVFFRALEQTPTMPTLRLAIRFMLLTLVRKSEFILAMWSEVDFDAAVWTIPKERMKAGRPHNVYLSQQARDILVAFKTCFGASSYVHPGRYETASPIVLVKPDGAKLWLWNYDFAGKTFNLDQVLRTCPVAMMKGRLERKRSGPPHLVPLPQQAVSICATFTR
jgi:integrase